MNEKRKRELYGEYLDAVFRGIEADSSFTVEELHLAYTMCGHDMDTVLEMCVYSDECGILDADRAMERYLANYPRGKGEPYINWDIHATRPSPPRETDDFLND